MDIFREMFATGGNIGPNRAKISSGGSAPFGSVEPRRKFYDKQCVYFTCNGVKHELCVCALCLCDIYLCSSSSTESELKHRSAEEEEEEGDFQVIIWTSDFDPRADRCS